MENRDRALDLAIKASGTGATAEEILARATAFHTFLFKEERPSDLPGHPSHVVLEESPHTA
jgi:hypothetical protein